MAADDTTIASARQPPASRSMPTTSYGQGRQTPGLDNKPDHDNHEPSLYCPALDVEPGTLDNASTPWRRQCALTASTKSFAAGESTRPFC